MKIATWNVNSIRARMDHVQRFLRETAPDVLCLQETKVTDAEFPTDTFARQGYETHRSGQKSYNGVAIITNRPVQDVRVGLSGAEDGERRFIIATVDGLRVASAYIPNGKSLDSPAFQEKLSWLEHLVETLRSHEPSGATNPAAPLCLCGDFNVAREDRDVFDPAYMRGQIHFTDAEHEALSRLETLDLVDAFRHLHHEAGLYSWWDYRAGSFRRNRGLRIDYVWISRNLLPFLRAASIDKIPRGWDKPSDHAPVVVELDWPG